MCAAFGKEDMLSKFQCAARSQREEEETVSAARERAAARELINSSRHVDDPKVVATRRQMMQLDVDEELELYSRLTPAAREKWLTAAKRKIRDAFYEHPGARLAAIAQGLFMPIEPPQPPPRSGGGAEEEEPAPPPQSGSGAPKLRIRLDKFQYLANIYAETLDDEPWDARTRAQLIIAAQFYSLAPFRRGGCGACGTCHACSAVDGTVVDEEGYVVGARRVHMCGGCCPLRFGVLRCGRCLNMWYCGEACQRQDWPRHREECIIAAAPAKRGREAGAKASAAKGARGGSFCACGICGGACGDDEAALVVD